MTTSNLPQPQKTTTESVKTFFFQSYAKPVSFPAAEIDTTVAFFVRRGFGQVAAGSISIVLLNQARSENVSVFALLDTLKGLTDIQLSQVITQVLNASRDKTSLLGYRTAIIDDVFETRNILI
jgi:hypothetical protein